MLKIFSGVLIYITIFFQLYYLRNSPLFNLINYVSYFTVLSNLFVALVFIFSGVKSNSHGFGHDMARGASALYILVTGFGFVFLLGGQNEQLLPWVNIILHYIAPCIALVDWIIVKTDTKIDFKHGLFWLAPPVVYFLYVIIRGKISGWYPYEFLNPNLNSTYDIIINSILVLLFSITIIFLMVSYQKVRDFFKEIA